MQVRFTDCSNSEVTSLGGEVIFGASAGTEVVMTLGNEVTTNILIELQILELRFKNCLHNFV